MNENMMMYLLPLLALVTVILATLEPVGKRLVKIIAPIVGLAYITYVGVKTYMERREQKRAALLGTTAA